MLVNELTRRAMALGKQQEKKFESSNFEFVRQFSRATKNRLRARLLNNVLHGTSASV